MTVDLGVVVPVYNAGDFLIPLLVSLENQQFDARWEVIVVDNGSEGRDKALLVRSGVGYRVYRS